MENIFRMLGLESHPPITFVSRHSKEECVRRLKEVVGGDWALTTERAVVGPVNESSFRIRKRIRYRNSFQPNLICELEQRPGDTLLRCYFGFHPVVGILLGVWIIGAVIFGIVFLFTDIPQQISKGADGLAGQAWLLFNPITPLIFVYAIIRFGLYLARNEPQFLVDFLREQLDASETIAT